MKGKTKPRRAGLSALILLLAGCATATPDAVMVEWKRTDRTETTLICQGAVGCARWNRDVTPARCVIYGPDFTYMERGKMATLGHEVKHCFDGPWH